MTDRNDRPDPSPHIRVETRFFPVSAALRPYASIIYLTDVHAPPGLLVDDYLHPEWANMRFLTGDTAQVAIGSGPPVEAPAFVATGPTSKASYFILGNTRVWGIGILPMGWAKFVPLAAEEFADRFCDGSQHPAFAALAPLADRLARMDDIETAARSIDDYFTALLANAPRDDPAILAAHNALVDDDLASVTEWARILSISERSAERLSRRAFGFPPKLLIRRQRFLRSLARFMLDPSMAWIDTLDYHYYDQAQFTRDFHGFMGMGPRAYAARPKPILGAAAVARAAALGAAMQGLHRPGE